MLEPSRFDAIDFETPLREQRALSSFGNRDAAQWNHRAAKGRSGPRNLQYARDLIPHLDLSGVRTILDIGCGSGALAVPLALHGYTVHSLDFSARQLDRLRENAAAAGLATSPGAPLQIHELAWEDPWPDDAVPACDLALCSRAMDFGALRACLEKMNARALRRAVLVLHCGGSYLGPDVEACLRRPLHPRADYIYAVAMLYQMGIRCSVNFLPSAGGMSYGSPDEFLDSVRWRVGELAPAELDALRALYDTLPRDPSTGRALYDHPFLWAVLAWEKDGVPAWR